MAQLLTKSYMSSPKVVPFLGRNVGQQLNYMTDKCKDKEMFVFYEDKERYTLQQIKDQSIKLAAALLKLGLKKGDCLAIVGGHHIEYVVAFYACAQIGVILDQLRLEFMTRKDTRIQFYKQTSCKAIFLSRTPSNLYDDICEIIPNLSSSETTDIHSDLLPDVRFIITAGPNQSGCYQYEDVLKLATDELEQTVAAISESIHVNDILFFYHSTGSTTVPKAIPVSHNSILNSMTERVSHRHGYKQDWVTRYITEGTCGGSSHHGILGPIVHGNTTVIPYSKYDATVLAAAIQDEKCTEGLLFACQVIDLMRLKQSEGYDFSSMKIANPTGCSYSLALRRRMKEVGLAEHILMMYGAIEMCDLFWQHPLDTQKRIDEGFYYPVGGTEVKIVDEKGNIVPIGSSGEICVRGFSVLSHYHGQEEKTKKVMDSEGWYHAGDIGTMDDGGFIQVTDRITDFVIVGGVNVAPSDLESVLYQHPDIQDVLIVAVPDKYKGEEICVCIIATLSGNKPTLDELKEFTQDKVINTYSVPRYVLYFDDFPRTEEGKFHRRSVKKMAISRLNLEEH